MDRNVNIISDLDGSKIVLIHDVIFKGKRSIEWKDVEQYLRRYVGEFYTIADTQDIVYIGADLPDEYAHSVYTTCLKAQMEKQRRMQAREFLKLSELRKTRSMKKIEKISMKGMLSWVGIDMTADSHCLFITRRMRLRDTMCSM